MTDNAPVFTILLVDDEPANIDILKGILGDLYAIRVAPRGDIAIAIANNQQPDLILLDVMMPDMDGLEVCRRLKASPATADIPVIFVTALSEGEDEEKGFAVGAVDYLMKPVVPALVLARVRTHLSLAHQRRTIERQVYERTLELQKSQRSAIDMLAAAGHYNDNDTGFHIWRMGSYARQLAMACGWSVQDADLLGQAAPMHDTGKIGIPDEILKAPRKLTTDEMTIMKTHSLIGYEILSRSNTPLFNLAAEIALSHHERWDGGGYPSGLKGEAIPMSGRIVAVADVFDALTMKRPYKAPWTIEKAFEHIDSQAGSHFDPQVVKQFVKIRPEILDIYHHWESQEPGKPLDRQDILSHTALPDDAISLFPEQSELGRRLKH